MSRPFWSIREPLTPLWSAGLAVVPIVLTIAVWFAVTHERTPGQVESRLVSIHQLPAPDEMLSRESLRDLWFERELSRSAVVSLLRVCGGFLIALAVVLPLGVLMGTFTKVKAMFNPLMVGGGYLPIAALVPLTLAWFGTGEAQKVGFLAIATFVYLLPVVVQAIDDVDEVYLQTAQTQGATRWQQVRRVLLPIAAPDIYHALRLAFGVGWSWIILAEVVAAERGLGYIIRTAQSRGANMSVVYLTLAVILLMSFGIDQLWAGGYRSLFPYRSRHNG